MTNNEDVDRDRSMLAVQVFKPVLGAVQWTSLPDAGMAELADAADSKSAGTWYLAGSIPVPGTIPKPTE